MTKETIIDGIDVYECKHYIRGEGCIAEYYTENGYEIHHYLDCEDFPNCYYKQLQRKTAECEELKQALEKIKKEINESCKNCVAWKCEDCVCKEFTDIIKRTGGQRVKAAAYPFNARRPRQKAKEGEEWKKLWH